MAILVFVLSLILLVAGAAAGYQSLDLLPTGSGLLYALAGVVAVCAAAVTFAIAVVIRRIDGFMTLIRQTVSPATGDIPRASEAAPDEEVFAPPTAAETEQESGEAIAPEEESPININRAGHLPSLEAIESAPEPPPEPPPSLVGSYSSGGANYKIFADGSIEAELSEGTFKFASMSDFKRFLADKKAKANAAAD
jgi:hypothetical protein